MKKVFLILLAVSLSINGFAQYNKNKISLSFGPSYTSGNFGDQSITNTRAGFANTGINYYLFYCYNFTRNYSVGLKVFGNSNKYNTDPFIDRLNYTTGYQWTTETSRWSTKGLLLGIAAHIPQSKKFVIDIRCLGGYLFLKSPGYTLSNTGLTNDWYKIDGASSKALGYDIGTGFSYYIKSYLDILFNADYIGANFLFADLVNSDASGLVNHTHNFRRTFDIVNLTLGVGYNFTSLVPKGHGYKGTKKKY